MKKRTLSLVSLLAAFGAIGLWGCSAKHPARSPVGEVFPAATGKALSGETVRLPADFQGKPRILIVAYVQGAQFDADRWAFGLLQAGTPVEALEIPTLPGWAVSRFRGVIDGGMRGGIPREDWGGVVTVYGDDGKKIARFTGNEKTRNVRVLLLDAAGRVAWFHDRGYSPRVLKELDELCRTQK